MELFQKYKGMLGGVVVAIVVLLLLWYYYAGSSSAPDALTSTPTESDSAGAELLTALGNLKTVKLDASIFQDPVFQSLSDFGIDIPQQPVGRQNPFAPLAGSGGSSSLPSNIKSGTASGKQ